VAKFTDQLGREWVLKIDVPMLARFRVAGLNLGAVMRDPKGLDALDDPETLGRVLWVVVEAQATARQVDQDSFAAGFDGPTIFAAIEAFEEALADFRLRPAVAQKVKERLPAARAKVDAAVVGTIEATLFGSNATVTSSPGPSGSAPPG